MGWIDEVGYKYAAQQSPYVKVPSCGSFNAYLVYTHTHIYIYIYIYIHTYIMHMCVYIYTDTYLFL